MSKAVLISIHPKWCEMIASGRKTIEVRKTQPKIETPFKVYIYCTKDGGTRFYEDAYGNFWQDGKSYSAFLSGTVIGEFACDGMERVDVPFPAYMDQVDTRVLKAACLSYREAHTYLGHRSGYGWNISDLVIYDEPRPLTSYHRPCPESLYCESCAMWNERRGCGNAALQITRPPQSWCYIEELT